MILARLQEAVVCEGFVWYGFPRFPPWLSQPWHLMDVWLLLSLPGR
jgi:hypothetical protein